MSFHDTPSGEVNRSRTVYQDGTERTRRGGYGRAEYSESPSTPRPPPPGTNKDTTVNIATAFAQAAKEGLLSPLKSPQARQAEVSPTRETLLSRNSNLYPFIERIGDGDGQQQGFLRNTTDTQSMRNAQQQPISDRIWDAVASNSPKWLRKSMSGRSQLPERERNETQSTQHTTISRSTPPFLSQSSNSVSSFSSVDDDLNYDDNLYEKSTLSAYGISARDRKKMKTDLMGGLYLQYDDSDSDIDISQNKSFLDGGSFLKQEPRIFKDGWENSSLLDSPYAEEERLFNEMKSSKFSGNLTKVLESKDTQLSDIWQTPGYFGSKIAADATGYVSDKSEDYDDHVKASSKRSRNASAHEIPTRKDYFGITDMLASLQSSILLAFTWFCHHLVYSALLVSRFLITFVKMAAAGVWQVLDLLFVTPLFIVAALLRKGNDVFVRHGGLPRLMRFLVGVGFLASIIFIVATLRAYISNLPSKTTSAHAPNAPSWTPLATQDPLPQKPSSFGFKYVMDAWNNLLGQRSSYYPSLNVPRTRTELLNRLSKLEVAVSELLDSPDLSGVRQQMHNNPAYTDSTQIDKIRDRIDRLTDMVRANAQDVRNIKSKDIVTSQREFERMQTKLDDTATQLSHLQHEMKRVSGATHLLNSEVTEWENSVVTLKTELKQAEARLLDVTKPETLKRALDGVIHKALTEGSLIMRDKSTGKVRVDPAIWSHLKDKLVGRDELNERLAQADIALERHMRDALQSQVRHIEQQQKEIKSEILNHKFTLPSWTTFLQDNRMALNEFLESRIEHALSRLSNDEENGIVTKAEVKSLLAPEVSRLRSDVENIKQQLLKKLQSIEHFDDVQALSELQDSTAFVHHLIDQALEKYRADVLALPDYALASGGARVIPMQTSPTYIAYPTSFLSRVVSRWIGLGSVHGRPPVTAISADSTVGKCWSFQGNKGTLGIQLSKAIIPTAISLEHASQAVVSDRTSAPRNIEVWAMSWEEATKDEGVAIPSWSQSAEETPSSESEMGKRSGTGSKVNVKHEPYKLHSFEYNINTNKAIQTIHIPKDHPIPSRLVHAVQVRITDNWGNPNYTCLYRVRVHGDEL